MRYAIARAEEMRRERAYRIYVTDCLYEIGKMNIRYSEMISKKKYCETDPEIIKDKIKAKIRAISEERRE